MPTHVLLSILGSTYVTDDISVKSHCRGPWKQTLIIVHGDLPVIGNFQIPVPIAHFGLTQTLIIRVIFNTQSAVQGRTILQRMCAFLQKGKLNVSLCN